MATNTFAKYVSSGLDEASAKIDAFVNRGVDAAIKQGIDEYGFRLAVASYSFMKVPKDPKRSSPNYVGLHWARTKQFHSPPAPTGRPHEWEIRIAPQFMALWQEEGTRDHVVFDPNKARATAAKAIARKQQNRRRYIAKLGSKESLTDKERKRLESAERAEQKAWEQRAALYGARDTNKVMGYSSLSKAKGGRKGTTGWFKGDTPKAEAGKRRGQPVPVVIGSNRQIRVKGMPATKPITRAIRKVAPVHTQRMAALLSQAYERAGR